MSGSSRSSGEDAILGLLAILLAPIVIGALLAIGVGIFLIFVGLGVGVNLLARIVVSALVEEGGMKDGDALAGWVLILVLPLLLGLFGLFALLAVGAEKGGILLVTTLNPLVWFGYYYSNWKTEEVEVPWLGWTFSLVRDSSPGEALIRAEERIAISRTQLWFSSLKFNLRLRWLEFTRFFRST